MNFIKFPHVNYQNTKKALVASALLHLNPDCALDTSA